MISQAMLMISMVVIAPAPCRAMHAWGHLAEGPYNSHKKRHTTQEQKSEESDDTLTSKTSPPPYKDYAQHDPRGRSSQENIFKVDQEVTITSGGQQVTGYICEGPTKNGWYTVFTELNREVTECKGEDITPTGRFVQRKTYKFNTACPKGKDCERRQAIEQRIRDRARAQETSEPSDASSDESVCTRDRGKLCKAYELFINCMSRKREIFSKSKMPWKWCCFVTSCLGCLGTTICFCPDAVYGDDACLGDFLCNTLLGCACASEVNEAGEAVTCGFCKSCYTCCSSCDGCEAPDCDCDIPDCGSCAVM